MATDRNSNRIEVHLGTELKLNVHIAPIDGITIDAYDYLTEVYCSPKRSITIPKEKTKRIDSENYMICFDTTNLGVGDLFVRITAFIPDGDFDDNLRTEICVIDTGITIVK